MDWQQQANQFLGEDDIEQLARHVALWSAQVPDSWRPAGYSGLVCLLRGDRDRALQRWEQAIAAGATTAEQQHRREILVEQLSAAAQQLTPKRPEQALALYRQLDELVPERAVERLAALCLEADLGAFDPERYPPAQMTEILAAAAPGSLDPALVGKAIAILLQRGQLPLEDLVRAALPHFARQPEQQPTVEFLFNECSIQLRREDYERALSLARCAPLLNPECREAHWLLSKTCFKLTRFREAIAAAEREYELARTPAQKLVSNTAILQAQLRSGSWQAAAALVARHRQWLQAVVGDGPADLTPAICDRLIAAPYLLSYTDDAPIELRGWHERLGDLFYQNLPPAPPLPPAGHPLSPSPPLRLGYIGSTFRQHPVGWLSRWLFHYHNRDEFYITLYLVCQKTDTLTERLCQQSDRVRHLSNYVYDNALQIRDDGIEILVDLDSITHDVTYHTLAYKPAPVQVTWLGWDASGLPTIDYFIADRHVLPDNAQEYYRETLWRLPSSYIAVDGFEVNVPRRRREDLDLPPEAIVYFSAQNGSKRHPETIRWQLQILKAVPNSYLAIKGVSDSASTCELFEQLATATGVSPQRLRFLPVDPDEMTHRAHFALADVVLDTYPYNGASTTLEALWVGIPLVTRVGEQFTARNSYAFLTQLGIREGIARNEREYVEWGVKFGTDNALRWRVACQLRDSRGRSPLWNARQFAREMEDTYRQMWRNYINSRVQTP